MSDNVNRGYKDSVFCLLFNDKARLIELYNALFDTTYDMETPLDIDTIEDVFFVNMKNDIAFTIDNKFIVLTEHQSTVNPNMPLRYLVYLSSILQKKTDTKKLYGRQTVMIPRPEFVVFYNGPEDMPCYWELRLEDAFLGKLRPGEKSALNLNVKVYNINKEKNSAILKKSRNMEGYSELIDRIKRCASDGEVTRETIVRAVASCIEDGILPDFLEKYAPEVVGMLYKRFTEEEIKELYMEDGFNIGLERGMKQGIEQGMKQGIEQGIEQGRRSEKISMAAALKEDGVDASLIEKYTGLSPEEIEEQ